MPVRPPGPRDLPLVGALFGLRSNPLGFLVENARRYGPVAFYHLGPAPVFQLNDPAVIDQALVTHAKAMHKDDITARLASLLGKGLVTSEGDLWRRQRKIAAPSLGPRAIEEYGEAMSAVAARYAEKVEPGAVRDVHADMTAVTHEIVARTLLGAADVQADDGGVGTAMAVYMSEFQPESQGWRRLLPSWIPTLGRMRMWRAVRAIDRAVYRIIEDRRARPGGTDVLSRLLAARDDDGQPMSDEQLRDETVTFFLAGHETTALALTWTLDLLARHPDVRARLEEEVRTHASPSFGVRDLATLPFTTAVIKESMRVRPPVWAIGRTAIEACEIGGHPVEKGAEMFIAQWVVHRDDRFFADPERFLPERWLDGLEKRLPRHAYFPFGGGPRICIGNHFSLMEAVLVLATIARQVSFDLVDPTPIRMVPTVTLRPAGPVRLAAAPTAAAARR